jgi:hypothetical protein
MGEELTVHIVNTPGIHLELPRKTSENVRQDGTFSFTNAILVRPRLITITLFCSLHYLRMVQKSRIDVRTLGTYFVLRGFKIFLDLIYV